MANWFDIDNPITLNGDLTIPSSSLYLNSGNAVISGNVIAFKFFGDGSQLTNLPIPDMSAYVLKSTTITAGTGLTGGGNLSGNQTLSIDFGTGSNQVSRGNHTHSYLPLVGGTLTGYLLIKEDNIYLDAPATTGGWARGIVFRNASGNMNNFMIGHYGSADSLSYAFLGNAYNTPHVAFYLSNGSPSKTSFKTDVELINQATTTNHPVRADRLISAGTGLTGGGNLIADRVISVDFGISGTQVASGNHLHDDRYYTETEVNNLLANKSDTTHNHNGVYEPVFTKNTAFNKNFGTASGTVAEGNHTHSYLPLGGGTLSGDLIMGDTYKIKYGDGRSYISGNGPSLEISSIGNITIKADNDMATEAEYLILQAGSNILKVSAGTANNSDISFNGYQVWHSGIVTPASASRNISAGTGLSGGGDLSADRTLSVVFGTTAGTVAQGNHSHSNYVANNVASQTMNGSLTITGNGQLYLGATNGTGYLMIRGASGVNAIQLDGAGTGKQTNVKAYIDRSGNAQFDGTVTINTLATNSSSLVTNLNAEMINSVKESAFAKNSSILEITGYGVHSGMDATQDTTPNFKVKIADGVVYTDSGMRVVHTTTAYSMANPSTSYDRIDVIYVQGSSGGTNEGKVAVATGTPASSPAVPSIPADAVPLAQVRVRKSATAITDGTGGTTDDITDIRRWRNVSDYGAYLLIGSLKVNLLSSVGNYIETDKPIKGSTFAKTLTIPAGSTSVTWTHNLGLGTSYAVTYSTDSPNRHVFWSSKATNSIVFNIDDSTDVAINIDAVITAY